MSNDNVKTMVDSLADGDNVAAQDAFKNCLLYTSDAADEP